MKKIEQEMLNAIPRIQDNGGHWQKDNTSVRAYVKRAFSPSYTVMVSLHGNPIAMVTDDGMVLPIRDTFRKWPTRTTVSRLRALGVDASIRKGEACINGRPLR